MTPLHDGIMLRNIPMHVIIRERLRSKSSISEMPITNVPCVSMAAPAHLDLSLCVFQAHLARECLSAERV
jgi:hypothetical protein